MGFAAAGFLTKADGRYLFLVTGKSRCIVTVGRTEKPYRERLLSQFSSGMIISIISYLPGGEEAAKAFEMMMSVLSDDNRKQAATFLFIRILWDNYILHQYHSFSATLFYVQSVKEAGRLYHLPLQRLSFF